MHKHADVVVIGGGFAGFWAAVAARRAGGPELSISVVTPNDSLVMRPRLYEANPETLAMPLAEPFAMIDVDLILASVTSIDPDGRLVRLSDGTDIGFGSAVLAIGSVMRVPAIPGVEHAFSIDDQASAIVLDRRLTEIAQQPTVRVAVIGAGFTGIELALELPSRMRQHGRTASLAPVEVVLIDRAPVVGPELGDGPRAEIECALDEQRVDRRLDATVIAIAPTAVDFADGSHLEVDAVVMCTGMAAAALADPLDGERDALGRYIVGATLEHPQFSGVFLTGDMASADTGTGHRTLQSCQHALQLGRAAGRTRHGAASDTTSPTINSRPTSPASTSATTGRCAPQAGSARWSTPERRPKRSSSSSTSSSSTRTSAEDLKVCCCNPSPVNDDRRSSVALRPIG